MTIQSYPNVYALTDEGLELFRKIMLGVGSEGELEADNRRYALPVEGTGPIEARYFETSKEMATAVIESLRTIQPHNVAAEIGLWSWMTFAFRECLFPKKGGVRTPGEIHRWYPSAPGDYRKAQRHLVRMPVLLLSQLGEAADHLLCGKPSKPGEVREQLTSQQDMMSHNFQAAARRLYFDDASGGLKRGAAGSQGGSARRLAAVRKQLDVTWDLTDLPTPRILDLVPAEFDRFKT